MEFQQNILLVNRRFRVELALCSSLEIMIHFKKVGISGPGLYIRDLYNKARLVDNEEEAVRLCKLVTEAFPDVLINNDDEDNQSS